MLQPQHILPLIILIIGPCVLILLIKQGCLTRKALDVGPSRRVGLWPYDLVIAFGLLILGPALVIHFMPSELAEKANSATIDNTNVLAFAYKALLVQASGQLLPVLYLLWRASMAEKGLHKIGAIPSHLWRDLRWGVLGFLVAVPLVMATIQIAVYIGYAFGQEAPVLAHNTLKILVNSNSTLGSVLIICSAVIVAPILEEGIFRGIVQSVMVETLGESRRWAVIIAASILFMFIHANVSTWENWQALPGLCVLSLVLGWLYERSGSLWPSIIVHMGFNAMNITMAILVTRLDSAA